MTTTDRTSTPRRSGPWGSAPFRWLLIGRTLHGVGAAISPVAMAFAVLHLGGSATELGLVVAAYAVVDVVTTLFAGLIGDRFSRTRVMQGSAIVAAASQGVVAVSLVGGWASIPLLAVMSGWMGCLTALAGPSSRAVVSQTVPAGDLGSAVAMVRLAQNTSMIVGFSAAGLLVSMFGPGWAIAVDAVTLALSAACFAAIRVPRAASPAQESMLGELRAGAAEVFRHTWLWLLIVQALVYHLVYGGAQGVLGPIVVSEAHGEPAWGWALGALMAGFGLGGTVSLRYRPRRMLRSGTAFLLLTALFPLAMGLELGLPLVLLGAFLHGFGLEIFSVNWDLAIQQNIPPDKLARVFAFDQVGSFVMRPLGLVLVGPVAAEVGAARWLLVVAAVMFGSTLLALAAPSVRTLSRQQ